MSAKQEQEPLEQRRRRFWPRLLLGLTALLVVGGIATMSLVGTQITAPEWVRQKISERINNGLGDHQIAFGEVAVVMQEGWKPRLFLRDVKVSDALGAPLIRLADVAGTVALKPLVQGQLQPASIQLNGARLILRRAADGAVDLALGDTGSTLDQAAGFAGLAEDLELFLTRPQFASLKRISAENLSVQFDDQRAKRVWAVDGGRLELARSGDNLTMRGDFALLGGRDYATTLALSYSGQLGSPAAELGVNFQDMATEDIAGQSPALAWLAALKAPISGALRASIDPGGGLGPLNATLNIGAGVVQPTAATDPIAFTSARSYFTYDPASQTMQFDELSVVSDWVTARAAGRATLVGVEDGLPREILGQMQVTQIDANPMGLYPDTVSLEGASMDVRLQINPFLLSLGQLSLSDQGSTFVIGGEVRAEPDGWGLALDGRMDALTPKRLLELWPRTLVKGTRSWIEQNVTEANLKNIQLALRVKPEQKPEVFLGFDFDGLATRFMKKVPPIRDASGHASLRDNRFSITANTGQVTAAEGGRIDISGTSFIVPDVRVKDGPARVRLHTSSTISAALSLLDEEPFRVMQKADKPVTIADGRARISGQLDFLLKKKLKTSEVAFDATAALTSVRSEILVPGRVVTAAELAVSANNENLKIGGAGQISGVPFSGRWQSNIGPNADGTSTFKGQIELSERFVDAFRIGLPPGAVSGAGSANITLKLARNAPGRFSLSSDLAGVGLRLQQLGWALPQRSTGTLVVAGELGEPPSIEKVRLKAGGLNARGTVSLHPGGTLDRASFSRVTLGDWLNAPVDLIGRGAGAAPAVRVRGGSMDLRQTSIGSGTGGTKRSDGGGPVSLELDRLQISDGIALTGFRAQLDMAGGMDGSFTGRINKGALINGRVVPQSGRHAFRIQSDNAGAVMVSAGLLQNARDGKMDLILTPAKEKGSYNGRLGIDDFRIRDIPSMAALLNAVSVIGILEQLQSDGLHFSRVDAEFHLSPDRVTLIEGSAVGASLGISMDGYYYMASKQMDMQGVFSPVYLVNAIGEFFTRKGEGLFGFNYTIKGSAEAPVVSVNPLSALTPGMFRNLFRRAPPKVQRDPGVGQQTQPAVGQAQGQAPQGGNAPADVQTINSRDR